MDANYNMDIHVSHKTDLHTTLICMQGRFDWTCCDLYNVVANHWETNPRLDMGEFAKFLTIGIFTLRFLVNS